MRRPARRTDFGRYWLRANGSIPSWWVESPHQVPNACSRVMAFGSVMTVEASRKAVQRTGRALVTRG